MHKRLTRFKKGKPKFCRCLFRVFLSVVVVDTSLMFNSNENIQLFLVLFFLHVVQLMDALQWIWFVFTLSFSYLFWAVMDVERKTTRWIPLRELDKVYNIKLCFLKKTSSRLFSYFFLALRSKLLGWLFSWFRALFFGCRLFLRQQWNSLNDFVFFFPKAFVRNKDQTPKKNEAETKEM